MTQIPEKMELLIRLVFVSGFGTATVKVDCKIKIQKIS